MHVELILSHFFHWHFISFAAGDVDWLLMDVPLALVSVVAARPRVFVEGVPLAASENRLIGRRSTRPSTSARDTKSMSSKIILSRYTRLFQPVTLWPFLW